MEQLVEKMVRKLEELEAAEKELDDVETWIDHHLDEMAETQQKLDTTRLSTDVDAIGSLVFYKVKQKSDITEIVDQLAESIETNVRAT